MAYMKCAHKVKLLKIDKVLGEKQEDQSLAMATGNAFDILIKCHLNRRYNKDKMLVEKISDAGTRRAALIVATEIFEVYRDYGPLVNLQREGIGYVGVDQEVELSWEGYKSILYGMPDVVLSDGTVIDWKVSGAYGRGIDPTNGYIRCFFRGKDMGPSGKVDEYLENINTDWAIQTYLYARLLGKHPGDAINAGIEQIAIKNGDIYCASFRNPISKEFQLQTEENFHKAFHALTKEQAKIPGANPGKWTCNAYNRLCQAAEFCEPYKVWKRYENEDR